MALHFYLDCSLVLILTGYAILNKEKIGEGIKRAEKAPNEVRSGSYSGDGFGKEARLWIIGLFRGQRPPMYGLVGEAAVE